MSVSNAVLRALPKVDLHCHLDGSLRPATLIELSQDGDAEALELSNLLSPGARHGSLELYLSVFRHTLAVLQTEEALERVAFELAEDAAAENVRWLEVRYCPTLCQAQGLPLDAIVAAVRAGLTRAEGRFGIAGGQIICALRDRSPEESLALAQLALRHTDVPECPGAVVGFDLAGPELGHPAAAHATAFALVRERHLWRTCHAGEADGPASIAEALDVLGANRLGHAVSLIQSPELLSAVVERQIGLEVCLSSNVQTGAVVTLVDHPLPRYLAAGARVALSTDNRLMSDTTVTKELSLACDAFGLGLDGLTALLEGGIDAAFLPKARRTALRAELAAHLGALRSGSPRDAPLPGGRD